MLPVIQRPNILHTDEAIMSLYYLDHPFPIIDADEWDKFIKESNDHFKRQKKCRFWKRVSFTYKTMEHGKIVEITSLSHSGDCHHIVNRTHNCGRNLCPIPNW